MNSRLLSQLRSMGYRTGDWVLLRAFFLREIRNRYAESIGGGLWTLFHPLVLLGIYALVFRTIFQVRFPELGQHAFVEFVAVALWRTICQHNARQYIRQYIVDRIVMCVIVLASRVLSVRVFIGS